MDYSNAETIPTFKRQAVKDERLTNVKMITDAEQLRQRKERDMKEAERLLHFDLQLSITPLKLYVMSPEKFPTRGLNEFVSCILQEWDYKKNEYVTISIPTDTQVMIVGKENVKLHGDIKFQRPIGMVFEMGAVQRMRVCVVAKASEDEEEEKGEIVGQADFIISELLNDLSRTITKDLVFLTKRKPRKNKIVTIRLHTPAPKPHPLPRNTGYEGNHITIKDMDKFGEVEAKQLSITMKILLRDLPIMDRITKNTNPFFQVFKDGIKFKQKLYQSEIQSKKLSCTFRTFSFGIEGERSLEKPMLIEVWHRNALLKNEFVGIIRTDIYDLRSGKVDFNIQNPDIPTEPRGTCHIKKYEERIWLTEKVIQKVVSKKTGKVKTIENIIYKNDFSILNYLGYYPVYMALAIDFTASNGVQPETNSNSFHYLSGNGLNPYQKSMIGLRDAIYQWGHQHELRMYGFGGVKKTVFEMKDLKANAQERSTATKEHMLKVYKKFAKKTEMGFDNDFTRIIIDVAKISERVLNYYVLTILLDGDQFDYQHTYDVIKKTQRCGMSIVFVGIGGEPFKNLLRLQQECKNVTFTRYVDNEQLIARNALYKLPAHMLAFFAIHKVVPEDY
jgi:hypothetical protein